MSGFRINVKKFLPRTLLGRSLTILIMPVLLVQIIATYVFFDRHWTKITSRMSFALAGEIALLVDSIESGIPQRYLDPILNSVAHDLDILVSYDKGASLQEQDAGTGLRIWESAVAKIFAEELHGRLGERPFTLRVDFEEKWVQVAVKLKKGVLNVAIPQRRLFSTSSHIFLLWMTGSSIVLLVIAVLFMRNQIRPIRKLAAAAERFGKGWDIPYFKVEGASEVRQAGQAFLDMQKRIRRQIEQRTTMLAGVSHDLRTPLTRLKLQLAMMGGGPDIDAMHGDLNEMEKMIEGYLDFVRGEGDEPVSLTSLNEIVDRVSSSARRQGYVIETDMAREIYAMLRPLAFERCLNNIVNNAGKYAGRIRLSADVKDRKIEIAVDDNGPGIAENQYEEVFRPFYRVESSRNAATGGVGLGLPIAMDIVHAHGGKIWLEKSRLGGLRVMIRVPL